MKKQCCAQGRCPNEGVAYCDDCGVFYCMTHFVGHHEKGKVGFEGSPTHQQFLMAEEKRRNVDYNSRQTKWFNVYHPQRVKKGTR